MQYINKEKNGHASQSRQNQYLAHYYTYTVLYTKAVPPINKKKPKKRTRQKECQIHTYQLDTLVGYTNLMPNSEMDEENEDDEEKQH